MALLVFGNVRHFKLPVVASIFSKGGHNILGEEAQSLDLDNLVETLQKLRGEVDSYAICAGMSIKNPAHELVAEKAVKLVDPKPVFCSHQVSSHPGIEERSATACLHAKLQPIMLHFLNSIQHSMQSLSLNCPAVIVCGDGNAISFDETLQRAALTIASGPAASARFGAEISKETSLVVDVGGTTTDVCLLEKGIPVINNEGCQIGAWKTHVQAVDMYTAAGGGDSHVHCNRHGLISLESHRVQPLALSQKLPDPRQWLNLDGDSYYVLPFDNYKAEINDKLLTFLHSNGPATPSAIAKATGIQGIVLEKKLERLAYEQFVTLAGFTPTDALHVINKLGIGNRQNSLAGAEVLAEKLGMQTSDFCEKVLQITSMTIEKILLTYLARSAWSMEHAEIFLNRRSNNYFSTHFSLHLPLIGIGAAARFFLPEIAERLGTEVSFPNHYEIGNAIGAALIGMEQFQS